MHSIVGIGGIGKTTVAQSIYNDQRIVNAFDKRMWVSVSHNFDKINLIKEIIAHASDDKNIKLIHFNFNMLQEELNRIISNKKFLLVLDDVWYDESYGEHINREKWWELIAPMENAVAGSKILVTTRMELVAKVLDSSRSFLHGLGQDDSWALFRHCHNSILSSSTLESIGMQIVRKLNGSPQALNVIGRHLYGRHKVAEWNEVLHSNILNSDDMLTILRPSYEGLPVHLQRCFSYCSLFPKGYHIDPEKLIYMWIAQDFIDTKGSTNKSLKDSGRSYFDELLSRSFFQMLKPGSETFYVTHDIMSDLALHVSQGECLRVECESMEPMPLYTQHLSIYSENLENLVNCDLPKLRSLIVLNKSWFCSKICLNHAILGKLKSVRVLDITGCCLEQLPDAVNRLIHLRYLGIRRTLHPLPRKMLMYHLQALFVQYHSCYSQRGYNSSSMQIAKTFRGHFHLPESINKLVNLVHVDVEKAYVLMLSSTLKLPFVECAGEFHVNDEGSLLGLKDLNMIRGHLTLLSLDKVQNKEEASKAHLHHKEHIMKLELQWGSLNFASSTKQGVEVLDVLKPHSDLEELTISGYPGARSPSWLESGWLSRLQFICLRDCNRWEVLPPLGDLPLLKTVEIRRMQGLRTLGQKFFGRAGFPSLERLLLERLPELEWCCVDNDQVFQNLRHLSVAGCPKLREYPTYPWTLEHIAILDEERIQVKTFIPSARVSRTFCILVSSFFHVLRAHHLEFVEDMEIYVNHVVCMSREVLENLKSLQNLKIYGIHRANTCSVIAKLWDENGSAVFPSSLRSLQLVQCYLKPSYFSKQLNNLSSLETLRLINCDTIEMPCPPVNMWHLRILKQLVLYKCDWITFLEGSEALVSLEEMAISDCYDLKYVPDLNNMPSLEKLHLRRCPQVMRLSSADYQTRLKELVIESCDALSSLRELQGLVSLTKLIVANCSKLELLPGMDSFCALGILIIEDCRLLRSLPERGLPVSLRTFVLDGCHQALDEQFQKGEGPDWNKVAALPGCMRYEHMADVEDESVWHSFYNLYYF